MCLHYILKRRPDVVDVAATKSKPGNEKRKRRIVEEEEEARWNLFSEI